MNVLRESWDRAKLEKLRHGLSRLVSPATGGADFRIELDLPKQFSSLAGPILPPAVLSRPKYTATGHVESSGKYKISILLPGDARPQESKGRLGILSDSSNEQTGVSDVSPTGPAPQCGPFKFEFKIWDRDQRDLKPLAGSLNSTLEAIRQDLDNAAGVNVYRDEFRVLPYGEPGNDWLRLDSRRIQNPSLRLSNNQIIGNIFITADENPELKDQTNREGLVEGPALSDFQTLIKAILSIIELPRSKLRQKERERENSKRGKGLFDGPELGEIRAHVGRNYPRDKKLKSLLEKTESELGRKTEQVQEALARYRRLATLGQLIDTVLHEGRHPLAGIRNQAQAGRREFRQNNTLPEPTLEKLLTRFEKIDNNAALVGAVFNRIEPFGGRKPGKPKEVILEDVISSAFAVLEGDAKDRKVEFSLPSTKTTVRIEPTEIQQVILNLLQNSLHWLRHTDENNRKVQVDVTRQRDDSVAITFSDSGPGIASEYRDQIFTPYFSTKPDGVGLGLAIVGDIVTDYYDGTLELLDSGPLPGATFRAILRKRV
ncbi:GHKL domain-containing protein [Corallococcus sp. AB032C]|nr:GHKL domain-containing protein [Corallococcus sp. AB032C]